MTKFSLQFSLFIISFFVICFSFSRIDWMTLFQIEKQTTDLERKLGDLYASHLDSFGEELEKGELYDVLEEIKKQLCDANQISSEKIKLHVIRTKEVNAFAAPDNHLVIFTGLIDYCTSYEEVAGVMAHEIAHMEKNHIMKKLAREMGISVLVSTVTSGSIPVDLVRLMATSAYDRSMETEADETAVQYLMKADINPLGLADMMYRLSLEESILIKSLSIISSHPDSEKRVESIMKKANGITEYTPLQPGKEWDVFQALAS